MQGFVRKILPERTAEGRIFANPKGLTFQP